MHANRTYIKLNQRKDIISSKDPTDDIYVSHEKNVWYRTNQMDKDFFPSQDPT